MLGPMWLYHYSLIPRGSPTSRFWSLAVLEAGKQTLQMVTYWRQDRSWNKASFPAGFELVERGRLCMSRAWENEANKKILACSFVQNDASTIMRSITGLLQSLLVSQAIPFTKGVACETKC